MLLGLSELTGYTPNGRGYAARGDTIQKLTALSVGNLKEEIRKALAYGTLEAGEGTGRFGGTDVVLKAANHVADAKDKVIAAWTPTKEWLRAYQKGAIEGFCKQRGVAFAKAYDTKHGKGAFGKLMKKKKDEIIDDILEFDFDWSAIAPKELTELVR
jgi:hypothetical protein